MSSSRIVLYKESRVSRAWRRWAGSTLLALLLILTPPLAQAGLLGRLLHPQGDSGSGKVARLAFRLDDASFEPYTVVWSPDGRFIATGGIGTRTIHIWDVAQRKLVKVLELPNPPAPYSHNMAWSPDGRYLAACNAFATSPISVRIYSAKDWSVAKDLGNDDGAIGCIKPAYSSDGKELTVLGVDLITFATSDWRVIRRIKSVQVKREFSNIAKAWYNQILELHDMAYVSGTHTLVLGGGIYQRHGDMRAHNCAFLPLCGSGVRRETRGHRAAPPLCGVLPTAWQRRVSSRCQSRWKDAGDRHRGQRKNRR